MGRRRTGRRVSPAGPAPQAGWGLGEDLVRGLSRSRREPGWMLELRLDSLRRWYERPVLAPFGELPAVGFDGIAESMGANSGDGDGDGDGGTMVATDDLAADAAERDRRTLERQGVVFGDLDTAIREHPELVREHLGRVVPDRGGLAALNAALWSTGSFIHVPPGVEVEFPLQSTGARPTAGPFQRTLVVADDDAAVQYLDGCSAPVYTRHRLQVAVVEVVVGAGARVSCATIQNWSSNVCNLTTRWARVETGGRMAWTDADIGSGRGMQHSGIRLVGARASGEVRSVAYAGAGRRQDSGAELVHAAPDTTSRIVSRSIARAGGRVGQHGSVRAEHGADGCATDTACDVLILDDGPEHGTGPVLEIDPAVSRTGRRTSVSRVAAEQLFYLMSRGLSESQAAATLVDGFIEPVTRTLPLEYAVEWSRLIELQLDGSVG